MVPTVLHGPAAALARVAPATSRVHPREKLKLSTQNLSALCVTEALPFLTVSEMVGFVTNAYVLDAPFPNDQNTPLRTTSHLPPSTPSPPPPAFQLSPRQVRHSVEIGNLFGNFTWATRSSSRPKREGEKTRKREVTTDAFPKKSNDRNTLTNL